MNVNFVNKKFLIGLAVVLTVAVGAVFVFLNEKSGDNLKSEAESFSKKEERIINSNGDDQTKTSFDSLGIVTEKNNSNDDKENNKENNLVEELAGKSFVKITPVLINAYLNFDFDGDGFSRFQDCRDDDENINPGLEEICRNQIDDNCDGEVDENCGIVIKVPEDYQLIQEAINSAYSGDLIKVAFGIYQENIVMKEGVSLTGEEESLLSKIHTLTKIENEQTEGDENSENDKNDQPESRDETTQNKVIIDGGRSGNVVSFPEGVTEKTKLSGFIITSSGKNLNGIFIDSASPIVENNIIENNDYNIYIRGNSFPLIQKNISRLSVKGIQIYNNKNTENSTPMERLEKSKLMEIELNSDENSDEENEEREGDLPIAKIVNNLITDNRVGIDLYQSSALIEHNTISYNNHYGDYYGPTYGVYLLQSSAKINSNIITDNGICELCAGISVDQYSAETEIEFNDIWNNQNNYFCSLNNCDLSETNISVDPEFVNSINNDYHLNLKSLCREAGRDGKDMGVIYDD